MRPGRQRVLNRAVWSSLAVRRVLHEIRVPTLILVGKKDPLVPAHLAEGMHARIAGSKMIAFGGGHILFMRQAQEFMDAVLAFLDSLDQRPT